jgi:hypothetical protein
MTSVELAGHNSTLLWYALQIDFKLPLLQALNLKWEPITRLQNHLCLIISDITDKQEFLSLQWNKRIWIQCCNADSRNFFIFRIRVCISSIADHQRHILFIRILFLWHKCVFYSPNIRSFRGQNSALSESLAYISLYCSLVHQNNSVNSKWDLFCAGPGDGIVWSADYFKVVTTA